MEIKSAEFIKSSTHYKDCPTDNYPEYAFMGRSNVGKSSLINMITSFSNLAKTSQSPGKTQLINHFLINNEWFLADLPGFGYAKASKKLRQKWGPMIQTYMLNRENLICTFLLVDSRHEPQSNDLENMEWLGKHGLPFTLIFTKTDKLSATQLQGNISKYRKKLSEFWDPLPDMFITSSEKNLGRDEILQFIDFYNKGFYKEHKS